MTEQHHEDEQVERAAAAEASQRERLQEAQERAQRTLERADELENERVRLEQERPPPPAGDEQPSAER